METTHFNLFPTLITYTKNFLTKEQCGDIMKYIISESHNSKPHTAMAGDSVSNHDIDTDKKFLTQISTQVNGCENILNDIQTKITEYSKITGLGYEGIELRNSWFNIQQKNSKLKTHTHPLSTISGGLYINVDENSSPIYFYNPVDYVIYSATNNNTNYNYQWFRFKPEIGDFIVFPSWLLHGSDDEPNQTDNRIVISFNA